MKFDAGLVAASSSFVTVERFHSTRTNNIRLQRESSRVPRSKLLDCLADDASFQTPPPPPPTFRFVEQQQQQPAPSQVVEQPSVQPQRGSAQWTAQPNPRSRGQQFKCASNVSSTVVLYTSWPSTLPLPSILAPKDVPAPTSKVLQPEMRSRTLHRPPYCPRPRPVPSSVPADWNVSVGWGSGTKERALELDNPRIDCPGHYLKWVLGRHQSNAEPSRRSVGRVSLVLDL